MWRHGWLGDWRREACIGEAILAPWTGKENCAFDKDTPFLDFNCNTICLATNQVFPLRSKPAFACLTKVEGQEGHPKMSCCD